MGFTRSGMPTHLEPWRSVWAASGNGFEVDFVPDYRILHDAAYHVLTYDLRNHGLSGAANGGITSSGIFEARDVVGSLTYARSRPDTRKMAIGLFSRCLGASSTFAATGVDSRLAREVPGLTGARPGSRRPRISGAYRAVTRRRKIWSTIFSDDGLGYRLRATTSSCRNRSNATGRMRRVSFVGSISPRSMARWSM